MSVNIYWRTIPKGRSFKGSYTSSDLAALADTFGGGNTPVQLTKEDASILRAMARASGNREFYDDIADTVERVGEIEVYGEW